MEVSVLPRPGFLRGPLLLAVALLGLSLPLGAESRQDEKKPCRKGSLEVTKRNDHGCCSCCCCCDDLGLPIGGGPPITFKPPRKSGPPQAEPPGPWEPSQDDPVIPEKPEDSPDGPILGNPFDPDKYGFEGVGVGGLTQTSYTLELDDDLLLTGGGETIVSDLKLSSEGFALEFDLGALRIMARWVQGDIEGDGTNFVPVPPPGRPTPVPTKIEGEYRQWYAGLSIPLIAWRGDPFVGLGLSQAPVATLEAGFEVLVGYWQLSVDDLTASVGPTVTEESHDLAGYFAGLQLRIGGPISESFEVSLVASWVHLFGDGDGDPVQVMLMLDVRF